MIAIRGPKIRPTPALACALTACVGAAAGIGAVACSASLGDSHLRACNLVDNDKCQPGQMCVDPAAEHCVAAGLKTVDQPCTRDEDCVAEATCGEDSGRKVCKLKCDYTAGSCAPGLECHEHSPAIKTVDHLGYCTPPTCDPVLDTGCPAGQSCLSGPKPVCGTAGSGQQGAPCSKLQDCGAKLTCARHKYTREQACRPLCKVGAGPEAAAGGCTETQQCEPLLDVNGDDWPKAQGYCRNACHAVTNEGCAADQQCIGVSAETLPQCGVIGSSKAEQPCKVPSDCQRDTTCVPTKKVDARGQRVFKCKYRCGSGSDAPPEQQCPSGYTCIPLNDHGKPLPNHLGGCQKQT